jgi:GT2 family glycosyltransferase
LPEERPLVSLIIPTRNGVDLLKQCIDSIRTKTTYAPYEIIVVDNGSDEQATLDYLHSQASAGNIRVIRDDRPFNYSALNNGAIASANGELVGLINNDIEVISDTWLDEMVSLALQPGVGAVGAKLLYPDGKIQHAGVVIGMGGVAGHAHRLFPRDSFGYFSRNALISSFSAVTAACLIVRKSIYQQVGGLNEADLAVAFNDVDFCLRIREAGYRNVYTPYAELYHHESATRGTEDNPVKKARFAREVAYMHERWGDLLQRDPAYSPNLALDNTDFSLAWPPRVEPLSRHAAPHENKELA